VTSAGAQPMTRRPSRTYPTQPPPQPTPEEIRQGIARFKKRLDEGNAFEPTSVIEQNNIPHVEALAAAIDESLIRKFGADTLDYKRYSDACFFDNGPFNYAHRVPMGKVHASLARSKGRSIALLTQAMASLEERLAELPAAFSARAVPTPEISECKAPFSPANDGCGGGAPGATFLASFWRDGEGSWLSTAST
jgi:hypothetical protein